jgi:hypothetical protein
MGPHTGIRPSNAGKFQNIYYNHLQLYLAKVSVRLTRRRMLERECQYITNPDERVLQAVLRWVRFSRKALCHDNSNTTEELSSIPAGGMKDLLVKGREQKGLLEAFFVNLCHWSDFAISIEWGAR